MRSSKLCFAAIFATLTVVVRCNLALDFDDIEDLPCPCEPGFVCLADSNRCIPTGSSEPFKSCRQDTPLTGDELCPVNHRCIALNGQGPRCLPQCAPVLYARPTDGAQIAEQCPFETTCWESPKGGVCSEGLCRDNPNSCTGPGEQCVPFNGAGVCFTTCDIFQQAPLPCGANEICHPIGVSDFRACIPAGVLDLNALCPAAAGMCRKTDPDGRPMICATPLASTESQPRCRAICDVVNQTGCLIGETCPQVSLDLGVCEGS